MVTTTTRDLNHCAVCGQNVTAGRTVRIHVDRTDWRARMVAVTCGPEHAELYATTHPTTTARTEL